MKQPSLFANLKAILILPFTVTVIIPYFIYNEEHTIPFSTDLLEFLSIIFFLCFQIPYSDRIGLFSWMMLPILMAPYFSDKSKYSFIAIIVMILIYIGFNIYAK